MASAVSGAFVSSSRQLLDQWLASGTLYEVISLSSKAGTRVKGRDLVVIESMLILPIIRYIVGVLGCPLIARILSKNAR